MSKIDYQALREKAEKATCGVWSLEYGESRFDGDDALIHREAAGYIPICRIEGAHPESGFDEDFQMEQQANAEFIAAANPATVLALLDELEAAEKRIAELESLTVPQLPHPAVVSVPDERAAFETFMEKRFKDCIDRSLVKNGDGEYFAWDIQVAWIAWQGHAAMLQAEPVSNSDELPLDYLQGHKDGLEWAAQLAEANHPQTGDWLYDDPIDLARAIRKGPDMPTVQAGNSPVTPDGWVMVPKEPTQAMIKAWLSEIANFRGHAAGYRAAIEAAPQLEVNRG
ncbi:TPA: ead/Ea22-like family protein [Escherichia coli]